MAHPGVDPVARYVDLLLQRAATAGASDIHLEPIGPDLRVRVRVGSALGSWPSPPQGLGLGVIARLKALAGMDLAEQRRPQDGRLRHAQPDRQLDLRIASLPTLGGESLVLRLLDPTRAALGLDALGMPEAIARHLKAAMARSEGLVLATGPTGAGKTTTLHAALGLVDAQVRKVLTVEDPVEYERSHCVQVPVQPGLGLGFAACLRAFLRHDPDVILVGEIRDPDTARTAVQAALTGHLVLSSLHSNNAPGAALRLFDLGVEPWLVATALDTVIGQRLEPRPCEACGSTGCPSCHHTGYHGRRARYECLCMDASLRDLLSQRPDLDRLEIAAREAGWVPLDS